MVEELEYMGYRLELSRKGPGWKVLIFQPGSRMSLSEIPHTDRLNERDAVTDRAHAIVRADIAKRA
jgi:hypothetical protein